MSPFRVPPLSGAARILKQGGGSEYGSIVGLEYEVPQKLTHLLQCIGNLYGLVRYDFNRVLKRSVLTACSRRRDGTVRRMCGFWTSTHRGRSFPPPPLSGGATASSDVQKDDSQVGRDMVWRLQGGYIFYAGAILAGAGYCRQCRRRPAILPLQLRQGCQVCVKISAQRLPRVAQFNAC